MTQAQAQDPVVSVETRMGETAPEYQVRLEIGVQSFTICQPRETLAEAEWLARQLDKALATASVQAAPEPVRMTDAARDVLAERQRQIDKEGSCPLCAAELRPTDYKGYSVCKGGHVVSFVPWRGGKKPRVIEAVSRPGRYDFVRVQVDGSRKTVEVHGLVARAFHGSPPTPQHEVRHLDGDQHNNADSNLAWGTRADQTADQLIHGTCPIGSRNGNSKLTEGQVLEIKHLLASGVSPTEIAPAFGCSRATIYDIRHERKWTHV